jgi:hypothetical protein
MNNQAEFKTKLSTSNGLVLTLIRKEVKEEKRKRERKDGR